MTFLPAPKQAARRTRPSGNEAIPDPPPNRPWLWFAGGGVGLVLLLGVAIWFTIVTNNRLAPATSPEAAVGPSSPPKQADEVEKASTPTGSAAKEPGFRSDEVGKPSTPRRPAAKEPGFRPPAELLVGKWEGRHTGNAIPIRVTKEGKLLDLIESYEFETGGKYTRTLLTPDRTLSTTQKGKYLFIDEKRLEIQVEEGSAPTKETWHLTVTKDELVLVYAGQVKDVAGTSRLVRSPVDPKPPIKEGISRPDSVEGKPDIALSDEIYKRLEKSKRQVHAFYAKAATGGRLEVSKGKDVSWNKVVVAWHPAVGWWAVSSNFVGLDEGTVFVNVGPHPVAAPDGVVAKGECVVLKEGRLVKVDLAELEAEPVERWQEVDLTKGDRYTVALNDAPGGITLFAGRPCVLIEETPKGLVATPQLDAPGHLWLVGKGGVTWKGAKFAAGSIVAVGNDRQPRLADGQFRAWFQTAKAVPAYSSEDARGPVVHTFPKDSRIRLLVPNSDKTGYHKVALDERGESIAWISAAVGDELVFTERIGVERGTGRKR